MTGLGTGQISFSVIVASHGRPDWLRRCVTSLKQLDHPEFEIVVVADEAGLGVLDEPGIRCIPFEKANLSAARNCGVRNAGGDVCAFIDDDAVAEPMWLARFEHAFRETGADAAAGYVRGRNGISFQSRLSSVDAEGETHPEADGGDDPFLPDLAPGRALKLVGTNFAVRRTALREIGGFDEDFRYYLDDSDLSLRLMQKGARLASAPRAEVHHGFAPSRRRTVRRAPLDLFDIGRSTAIYLRKHLGAADPRFWERLEANQRARVLRHMIAGTCEPRDVGRRIGELRDGWKDGTEHGLTPPRPFAATGTFERFPARPPGHAVFASFLLSRRRALLREAEKALKTDGRASVFSFSLTPVRHRVRYVDGGIWLQKGGLYGRSDRHGQRFRWCRFAERLRQEIARVAKSRGIGEGEPVKRWDQTRFDAHGCESEDTR